MIKFKFIINPVPLRRKHLRILDKILSELKRKKIGYDVEYTSKTKPAGMIAKSAIKDSEIIVACGGDGTVMEVINGMYGSKRRLGILPFGTSNDFAKTLNMDDLQIAADKLIKGKHRKINLGIVEFNNGKKKMAFNSTSGIGFDAKMLMLNKRKFFIRLKSILGGAVYPLAALFYVFTHKGHHAEMIVKGQKKKLKLFMLNANFTKSMGGMKVTPLSHPTKDFGIFIVHDSSIFKKVFGFAWYAFSSKKVFFEEVEYFPNQAEFSINSKEPMPLQLNGDFVGYTPAKFTIEKNAIELIC